MAGYMVSTIGDVAPVNPAGGAAAPLAAAPVSAPIIDPVVVSVDGRLFAVVVVAAVGGGVYWAWKRWKDHKR